MNEKEMSLIEHLNDLRKTLIIGLGSWFVGIIIAWFFKDKVLTYISSSLPKGTLVYFSPLEMFTTDLKLSMILGFIIMSPIIFYSIWWFLAPGLYENEQKFVKRWMPVMVILFFIGTLFSSKIILPFVLNFFIFHSTSYAVAKLSIAKFISFYFLTIVFFGLMFQLPLVLSLLILLNIVSYPTLKKLRKFFYILIFLFIGFISPPDLFSQGIMFIPLMLLFEIGMFISSKLKPMKF
ncbi:Sec-independent protein translocase, TatC subunit [Thermodesulfobium narugense DSM 14796]|uniref:Sec-independent protein translocase protein TatC n=1 Tax=Thermodesulfobium narugense DSM 14796 TaxID=747365 RepID=M1E6L8_9BACT|nr:twin-arginine translocase subunit TatC [Thermodesulfobium narugense]AEE14856.1 Sec-independent protein translocase, TatC subunit [Thermodesulfobium narugense DSM 14796]